MPDDSLPLCTHFLCCTEKLLSQEFKAGAQMRREESHYRAGFPECQNVKSSGRAANDFMTCVAVKGWLRAVARPYGPVAQACILQVLWLVTEQIKHIFVCIQRHIQPQMFCRGTWNTKGTHRSVISAHTSSCSALSPRFLLSDPEASQNSNLFLTINKTTKKLSCPTVQQNVCFERTVPFFRSQFAYYIPLMW